MTFTDPCAQCWQKGHTCDRDPDDPDGKCAWCVRTSQACVPSPFPAIAVLEEKIDDGLKGLDASTDGAVDLLEKLEVTQGLLKQVRAENAELKAVVESLTSTVIRCAQKNGLEHAPVA